MEFANGDRYTGNWIDDKMAGQGTYVWSDGRKYEKTSSFILRAF